ncbi:MAG: hypothetical protein WC959_12485 [Kiritimatiellales bacterium]
MNMQWIDWTIVWSLIGIVILTGLFTKRYVHGVADYLSANRCAGRYLLTVAQGMAGLSAVSFVAVYEKFYQAGFPAYWWERIIMPISLIIAVTGFISYRFRETRALTMAQFFEMRYSRSFRVFSGIICWFSGIMNYGVFPGVTARLLIHLCGLPERFMLLGISVPTFLAVMVFIVGIALYLTLTGGQIALLLTDFIQGQFALVVLLVITIFLLMTFEWSTIIEALESVPAGNSMLNPYDQSEIKDFSLQFFVMLGLLNFYSFMAWQGSQGYYSSARTPHEAKMAGILGMWRTVITGFGLLLAPIVAFAVFHHAAFAGDAAVIQTSIDAISDPQVQIQMRTPLMLAHFLPVGMIGLLVALVISAAVSTDDTYLHSWGSIFVQDVLLPFKKEKLTASQHLKWLRLSVVGTAVFAILFSTFFPLNDYLLMYFQLTGAIFMGGAGSVIIGGLYWKRGTTAGAWTAMITGFVLAFTSVMLRTWWTNIPGLAALAPEFPLNGMQAAFATALCCIVAYVIVSFITFKQPHNMDKLLHRGDYAIVDDQVALHARPSLIWRLIGISKEYSLADKIIASGTTGYTLLWCVLLVAGTSLNVSMRLTDSEWAAFWYIVTITLTVTGVLVVAWFIIGGFRDIVIMFRLLKAGRENAADDGTVS